MALHNPLAIDIIDLDLDIGETELDIQPMAFSIAAASALAHPNLWHLSAGAAGGARFVQTWDGTLATGVTISIVDEGVNYHHADLYHAYDTAIDYDPRDVGEHDAAPDIAAHTHGTQVAGLLAGNAFNNIGTVGAAQGSTVTASYLRYGALFDISELADIIAHQRHYDVSNNSWGFTQAFADNFNTQKFAATAAALELTVAEGRDGLGTVMVFAAGNGKFVLGGQNIGDDSNFHNLTNSRFTIAVGAHDIDGKPTFFSSPGANVLLTAPGMGLLTTTGVAHGSEEIAYVTGTSFAAPLVSSTVALMLAENPHLGYRDVQEILVLSAMSRIGGGSVENAYTGFNGGGLLFDREGGFGLLDTTAAVALAKHWTKTSTLDNEERLDFSFSKNAGSDNGVLTLQGEAHGHFGAGFSMQWIEIDLQIFDLNLRGLRVDLISPSGTRTELIENLNVMGNRTYLNFTFTSVATWGENPYGTWSLELTPGGSLQNFAVYKADVRIFGDYDTPDDTYYFTRSFADLVAQDDSRRVITDTDGGVDTLNFAAGEGPAIIDLSGGGDSWFQGIQLILDGEFENVIGSAADDILIGSDASNLLIGGDGNDRIFGGGGDDIIMGGAGDDIMHGGTGSNTVDGGIGFDTYILDEAWAAYVITLDPETGGYRIEHGTGVDLVSNVERFVFADVTVDVAADAYAIVTGIGPELVSVVGTFADAEAPFGVFRQAMAGDVVALISASDPNVAAGDVLTFTLLDASGNPYEGPLGITKTGPTTAIIVVREDHEFADLSLEDIVVQVSDSSGSTATQSISLNILDIRTVSGVHGAEATPPALSVADQVLDRNAWAQVSDWLSFASGEASLIVTYEFWDGDGAAASAYFWTPDNPWHAAGVAITVAAEDLADVWVRGGAGAGAETLWVRAFDGNEWSEWDSFILTTTTSAPVATAADQSLRAGEWAQVAGWVSYFDADGDAALMYQFWDGEGAAASGYFWTPDNPRHAAGVAITVAAEDLANVWVSGGMTAGAETFWVRAFDGEAWGEWDAFTLTTTTSAPLATIADQGLRLGEWAQVADWVSYFDADDDAALMYQFWDGDDAATSGYFWTPDNPRHAAGEAITVAADDFAGVWVRGGTVAGTELMWVRAFDGTSWGEWDSFTLTSFI